MFKKTSLIVVLVFFCCLMTLSRASADGILAAEWGFGPFDKIIQTSTENIFANPGMSLDAINTAAHATNIGEAFDLATFNSWSPNYEFAYQVTASGNLLTTLAWSYSFNTNFAETPFSFEFYSYNGTTLLDWATITYNGGGSLSELNNFLFIAHDLSQVPEPATLLLLGLGLLGIVPLRKKVK